VRVELVDQQRRVLLAGHGDPAGQIVTLDQLAGGVAGVRQQQRRQAPPVHLAPQILHREAVAAFALQQDGDGGERLEDVQQLLVGRVVGQEVAQVDVPQAGRGAGQRGAAAARHADVLGRVLRLHPPAVEAVVEIGDGRAQLADARDGRVLLIVHVDGDLLDARRGAGQRARLGLALAQVAPVGGACAIAEARCLSGDIDDAGTGDGAERVDGVVVGHEGLLRIV